MLSNQKSFDSGYYRPQLNDKRRIFRIRRIFSWATPKYSNSKLTLKIKQLEISCGTFFDPVIRSTNIQEKVSLRLLHDIVKYTDRDVLQALRPIAVHILIFSSLVLVQAYVAHLKIKIGFWDRFKRKHFGDAVKYFHLLIYQLIPELSDVVIDTIMKFLQNEQLWNVDFICCEILLSLLACRMPPNKILKKILDFLEEDLQANNVKRPRHIIRILYKILEEQYWNDQKAEDCKRLIYLYYNTFFVVDVNNPYYRMRRGFEMCLVRMCEILQVNELMIMISIMFDLCFGTDLLPDTINDFSRALELAIMYADIETITKAVEPKVLQYVLEAVASDSQQKSRLASRILARLFDRHRNFAELITPRIFIPNKYYRIKISAYHEEDEAFFREHRTLIEYHLLIALRQHQTACNIETMFTVLCTMVIESPCGYTACQVISILLELQDFALALNGNACCTETNQMHAVVISVLMLIAWVHRASSLAIYVQRILNHRADDAPHLNPPIKLAYQYAQHHVMWNEPNLFFDFWEIRYGLWKRFRSQEPQLPMPMGKFVLRKLEVPEFITSKGDRVQDEIIASNLVRASLEPFD